jgi:hypothetical protein
MGTFVKAGRFGINPNKILWIRCDDPQWEGACAVFLCHTDKEEPIEIVLSDEDSRNLKEYVDQHTVYRFEPWPPLSR